MEVFIAIISTVTFFFSLLLALVVGNVINRCKRYEQLFKDVGMNQLNIALTMQKLATDQEKIATEMADLLPEVVRRGEVN